MLKIAAIMPAAGQSTRMGRPKQLLDLGGIPVIIRGLKTLARAGITDTHLVLGRNGEPAARLIVGRPVTIHWNTDPHSDMATSIRIGLQALDKDIRGVLIFLVDHPLVAPATVGKLLRVFRANPDKIVIPSHAHHTGHPILLPRNTVEELHELPTLREVIRRLPDRVFIQPVSDDAVLQDMDTPADYEAARKKIISRPSPLF